VENFFSAFRILSPKAKKRMLILLPVIIIGTLLETLSIGMVIPALGILMNEAYFDELPFINQIFVRFGNLNYQTLIIIGLSGLAGAFVLKNIFLFFQYKCQGTFVFSAQREIALNLFSLYLRRDYLFHVQTNSAKLLRNLTTEVSLYCSYFLMPLINLLTEMLVLCAILILIFYVEPKGTLFLAIFLGILIFLFVKSSNRVVGSWGQKRLVAEEGKLKHLKEGFGGIKEILLSDNIEFFLKRFHIPNKISGLMHKQEYIFQYVPKLGVEVIAILSLVGMCLFLLSQGTPKDQVTHMLGLMATAGFRIIPSFSRILNNLQSMRYGKPGVDTLIDEFNRNLPKTKDSYYNRTNNPLDKLSFINEIQLDQVSFSYANLEKVVLNNINLRILKGEIIGLCGESGSGKSTLVNLFLGLTKPSSGEILVDGKKLDSTNINQWQSIIGYVPQDIYLLDDSIRRNIAFGIDDEFINNDRIMEVVRLSQLEKLVESYDDGLDSVLGERGAKLSGGQRQRVGIARALYHDPKILVLDEATSALDEKNEREILNTFKPLQGKKTILIIAHRESALKMCSRIFEIRNGILELR
jgi:ATP-binding cassette, subfamily B, bacterial PglK